MIEPNATHYEQLAQREFVTHGRVSIVNTELETIPSDFPHLDKLRHDTILLSHVLYFFDDWEESLNYCINRLYPGGKICIVLNSVTMELATRTHLRNWFNATPEINPLWVESHLSSRGLVTTTDTARLQLVGEGEQGKQMLADYLTFLIPGKWREDRESILEYVQRFCFNGTDYTFNCPSTFLVGEKR